jgi:HlyD family secretion protein
VRKRWIIGTLVLAVLATGGWFLTRPRTKAPEYRTAVVDRGTIAAQITATGTVKPVTMVQVGSQVSGTIQSLHADFNSAVKKGQVVAQLDPSLFRTQLAQNEANLARAEVNVKDAERTFKRSQELLSRNLVSQAEVDAAEAAVDRFKAEVQQARAVVQQARVNLEHATILSPIDGVVVSRSVDVGQTVAASLSAPVLFEIANDLTAMQVEASIDEADIGQIKPGQPVSFSVDAFPDEKFSGTVAQTRLQPITVQNVVTYTTVIAVANPDLKLRPGMTANVSVEIDRREDVLRVPAAALTFRPPDARGGANSRGSGGTALAATPAAGGAPAARGPGAGSPTGGAPAAGGGNARAGGAPGGGGPGGRGGRASMGPTVYTLVGKTLAPHAVKTGLTDGYFTEIVSGDLKEGDVVVTGTVGGATQAGGMGGGGNAARNPLAGGRRGGF